MYDRCEKCHMPSPTLTAVQVCRQTHWSPAEWALWCPRCLPSWEQIEAQRDEADEKRWEVRTGR